MAGRGPAPKPKDQRRNRSEPLRGEWVDLPQPPEGERLLPRLEELDPGEPWHPRVERMWESWNRDPAATQFGEAEVAAVIELVYLAQEFVTAGHGDRKYERVSPSELRLRMDGLGLTAKGKRDLRWRTTAEQATLEPERPALAEVHELRAV